MKTEAWAGLTHSSMFLQPASPRWMKCVEETGKFFEPTLAALFVREAFGPSIRSAVCESFRLSAALHPSHSPHLALILWSVPFSVVCKAGIRQKRNSTEKEPRDLLSLLGKSSLATGHKYSQHELTWTPHWTFLVLCFFNHKRGGGNQTPWPLRLLPVCLGVLNNTW